MLAHVLVHRAVTQMICRSIKVGNFGDAVVSWLLLLLLLGRVVIVVVEIVKRDRPLGLLAIAIVRIVKASLVLPIFPQRSLRRRHAVSWIAPWWTAHSLCRGRSSR